MLRTHLNKAGLFTIKRLFLPGIYSDVIMRKNWLITNTLATYFLFIFSITALGQQFQHTVSPVSFNKAVALYESANYIAAEKMASELLKLTSENDPLRYDLDFYRLMSLVKQNKGTAGNELTQYLNESGGSPWENQLWFELARLQFNNRRYQLAARTFNNVNARLLNARDREDHDFYKGYSNFEAGNLEKASQSFFEVKESKSKYASSASYYWGYINYLEGNYQTALDEFSKLTNNREFSGFIQYYTIQIYYMQERYELVSEMGEKLIMGAPEEQKNELNKIVGDAFYETGQYIKAIKYLDAYKGSNGKKTPEDFFRLAYSYYQSELFEQAIAAFEKATANNDALAQNALYHLADCHLKLDQKNKARVAFEQASKYNYDPKIEEDALFNYAKLTYELSYSPFNETIRAFDQYIQKYPDSERNDAAFDYLVKVYMTTRNYRDAIQSIEKIRNQSPSVKEAYQRVTYFRGLELYNDRQYEKAISFFEKSLENDRYNRSFKAKALYWSGESNYRLARYDKAIALFTAFQSTPGAFSLDEFGDAYYSTGYCYYNKKDYGQAASWFRKYLNQSKKDDRMEADASNRVADIYYLNRDYAEAIKYYQRAYELKTYDTDYALFQLALCEGLQHQHNDKLISLQRLVNEHPRSSYIDDSYYEMARTYERLNNNTEAIVQYRKLVEQIPQSNYNKKANLQLGLIFYNKSDYSQSLGFYKEVLEKYPNSEEAKAALIGIKNNYVDMNNVDGYFAYINGLNTNVTISVNEQDSIFYMAAEKSYMEGKANAGSQLSEYLSRFPNGSFKTNALFYMAEYEYSNGRYSKSLEYYKQVAALSDNIFTEQALIKAGELTFNAEEFEQSLQYFARLEQLASTKWSLLKARLGMMRNSYAMNQHAETISSGLALLATDNITSVMVREAQFKLAKAYFESEQFDNAFKYFELLAADVKSIEGAEAKYHLARILFDKKQFDKSEQQIMDFISNNTPHQYWLAKSFVLLSDIYWVKEDLFQAKHTLKSIIDNYNNSKDGIIAEANQKLKIIELKEQETIKTHESSDSTLIP